MNSDEADGTIRVQNQWTAAELLIYIELYMVSFIIVCLKMYIVVTRNYICKKKQWQKLVPDINQMISFPLPQTVVTLSTSITVHVRGSSPGTLNHILLQCNIEEAE